MAASGGILPTDLANVRVGRCETRLVEVARGQYRDGGNHTGFADSGHTKLSVPGFKSPASPPNNKEIVMQNWFELAKSICVYPYRDTADMYDYGESSCCGAKVYAEVGICSACGEHCDVIRPEDEGADDE